MKKKVALFAVLGFLLSGGISYWLVTERNEHNNHDIIAEEVEAAVKPEITIKEEGIMIYQYYYTKDAITKEQQEPVPDFLEGLSREQLQSVYNGWQIVYFSPEKVILRCSIEGKSNEVFLLKEYNGQIAVFIEDESRRMRLKELTEVPVALLPETEQKQMLEGLYIVGEENLVRLLSDFTS